MHPNELTAALDLSGAIALCGPMQILRTDAVVYLTETDSTNALALEPGPDGGIYLAERQRAGRGRFGRSWHSAGGLGLWFSIRLTGPTAGLPFAAGLALRDALEAFVPASLKWPNDILSGGRKICGMLLEHREQRNALGIGVNVLHQATDFPPEIRPIAGSLAMARPGVPFRRESVLAAVLSSLDRELIMWREGQIDVLRERWIEASGLLGRYIRRGMVLGRVIGIEADGALIVQTAAGTVKVRDGDLEDPV